jgi:hypothetical protein
MSNAISLTPEVLSRIVEISNSITDLIIDGTYCELWKGKRPIVNPATGEITNKFIETSNLNVSVSKDLFVTVTKAIERLRNSGAYVSIELNNQKLIAISSKADEIKGMYFIHFTKQNQSKMVESTSDDFRAKFSEVFG